jgi:hypothetical protein
VSVSKNAVVIRCLIFITNLVLFFYCASLDKLYSIYYVLTTIDAVNKKPRCNSRGLWFL